jgi:hypothetical protein
MEVKWWNEPYDSRFRHIVEQKLNEYIYWPSGLELTSEAIEMLSTCSLAYKSEEYQTLLADVTAQDLKNTLILQKESSSKFRTYKVDAKTIMFAIGKADWKINKNHMWLNGTFFDKYYNNIVLQNILH